MDSSRRIFLKAGGAAAAIPAVGAAIAAQAQPPAQGNSPQQQGAQQATYLFFSAPEAALMEAMVDRLIPPDELGPGANEAGVVSYIDRQLAGAWGAGERLYRAGPWVQGT